jgi:hypothetical protein
MSDDAERERRAAEVGRKTAVLQLPAMERVEIQREQRYGSGGTFDLYVANSGAPAPTVVFVYGFPVNASRRACARWGRIPRGGGCSLRRA